MLIKRFLYEQFKDSVLGEKRVTILYGPRQAGKTTLLKEIYSLLPEEQTIFFNGDDLRVQEILGQNNLDSLRGALGNKTFLFIDEAQRIPNIGLSLKLIFDSLKISVVASGSASFELADKINEPLTGRSTLYYLYPLSLDEFPFSPLDSSLEPKLEEMLRFGFYPKVTTLNSEEEKQDYLNDLLNNYLYRDLLSFQGIRKPKKVYDLLSLLALQIGSEVKITELAARLSLSKIIVEKYLDILEKMFIIFNVRGFSRNLRKEIYKTSKYYFWDIGLRNALIRNFNRFNVRSDFGAVFENLCLAERIKSNNNRREYANYYFWRTYDQKEIDLIEEISGQLTAWEFKTNPQKTLSKSTVNEFTGAYPGSKVEVVNPQNLMAKFKISLSQSFS